MKNIDLIEAYELELKGKIKIYNPNTVPTALSLVQSWIDNFEQFKEENSQIPLYKLYQMFDYRIESNLGGPDIEWNYIYGKSIN